MSRNIRRYIGSFIDAGCFLLLFYLFTLVVSYLIVPNNSTYQNNALEMNQILEESGLYEWDDGELVEITTGYDARLEKFYEIYDYNDSSSDHYTSYDDARDKSGYFNKIGDDYVVKDDVSETDINVFYRSEVDKALVILFNETNYQELYQYNRNFLRWSSIICLVVSSSIFYLILPLIIRGQTLGRLIMKTEIVSQDDSKASIPQLIVRYIAFFMIVVLMSLWLYFIPLGVNLLVYFIDKKRRSLPDFFAVTYTREKYQETEKIIENKEGSQI